MLSALASHSPLTATFLADARDPDVDLSSAPVPNRPLTLHAITRIQKMLENPHLMQGDNVAYELLTIEPDLLRYLLLKHDGESSQTVRATRLRWAIDVIHAASLFHEDPSIEVDSTMLEVELPFTISALVVPTRPDVQYTLDLESQQMWKQHLALMDRIRL